MKQPVILFDGACNFCNSTINFIIDKDPKGIFYFSSLQSDFGQSLLKEKNLPVNSLHTIYLITGGYLYKKSDAVIEIVKHLEWVWPLSYLLRILPGFFRDRAYDLIAANRYRIFGKSIKCRIPSNELRKRFINQ